MEEVINLLLMWKWAVVFLIIGAVAGAAMVSAFSFSSCTIRSCGTVVYRRQTFDLNLDGRVDIIDVAMVARGFGSCLGDESWDPKLDFNGDLQIDEVDLSMIASNYWRK